MSGFDIPETTGPMTPDKIRDYALEAAARGIRHYAATSETLGFGDLAYDDETAIRNHMDRIARQVQMGGVL